MFWFILALAIAVIAIVLIAIRRSLLRQESILESVIASLPSFIEEPEDDTKVQVSVNASSQFSDLYSLL